MTTTSTPGQGSRRWSLEKAPSIDDVKSLLSVVLPIGLYILGLQQIFWGYSLLSYPGGLFLLVLGTFAATITDIEWAPEGGFHIHRLSSEETLRKRRRKN